MLEAQGFTFVQVDSDSDYVFKGELLNYPARIYGMMARDRLVKFQVIILTPDHKAREVYADMVATLTEKYGEPRNNFKVFESPYYEGDGYEEQAIRLGKATYAAFWNGLWVEITEQLAVNVSYESADWKGEFDRRKARGRRVF